MRVMITVLLLVVLPTTLLSILAGRAFHVHEQVLDARLEREAFEVLQGAGQGLQSELSATLDACATTFETTLLGGTDPSAVGVALQGVKRRFPWVADVYLFMNPWDFLYPPDAVGASDQLDSPYSSLRSVLVSDLAGEESMIAFGHRGEQFYFKPLPGGGSLYVGFSVDQRALLDWLEQVLDQAGTRLITYHILAVEPPRSSSRAVDDDDGIRVEDNLAPAQRLTPVVRYVQEEEAAPGGLVAARLVAPFEHVLMGASPVSSQALLQAYRMQRRLYVWGIIVLGGWIVMSTVLLVTKARREALAARRRSAFMAGISHDIRTPLAAMRVLAESLGRGAVSDPARQKQSLDAIVAECDRLTRLADRVLLFFGQERRMQHYEYQPVNMQDWLTANISRLESEFSGKVRFHLDVASEPVMALCDAKALEQVLTNLVDNAQKYGTPQGESPAVPSGVDIDISLGLRKRFWRNWCLLTVEDRGPGIPLRERRRIFERFYRGKKNSEGHTGGIGLGLSLTADIIRSHRGRIRVGEGRHGGAAFEIWLRGQQVGKCE